MPSRPRPRQTYTQAHVHDLGDRVHTMDPNFKFSCQVFFHTHMHDRIRVVQCYTVVCVCVHTYVGVKDGFSLWGGTLYLCT